MDSFYAIIQNHPGVEDVEKFIFLKNHLEPPASDLLQGFSTTNADYAAALKLFTETYGNKSLLTQIRISKLLNLERHDGASSLRPIYNQVRTHIRSLESMGMTAEDHSMFLIPIIMSKLTREMNKKWYRQKDKESINALLEWLQNEVASTESAMYLEDAFSHHTVQKKSYDRKAQFDKSNSHKSPGGGYNYRNQNQHSDHRSSYSYNKPSTATALHTTSQKHCYYCQKDTHDTQNCRLLEKLPSSEVRNFLKSQMLCFCCMKKNHWTYDTFEQNYETALSVIIYKSHQQNL